MPAFFSSFLQSFFCQCETIQCHSTYPRVYWALFGASLLSILVAINQVIELEKEILLFSKTLSSTLMPQDLILSIILICVTVQIFGLLVMSKIHMFSHHMYNKTAINWTNGILFGIGVFVYTVMADMVLGLDSQGGLQGLGKTFYTIGFMVNLLIFNKALSTKNLRNHLNQLTILDATRLLLVLSSDSKVLITLVLAIFLLVSLPTTFFNPVILKSTSNSFATVAVSFGLTSGLYFFGMTLLKIESTFWQLIFIFVLALAIYMVIDKVLNYRLRQLYQKKDNFLSSQEWDLLLYLQANFIAKQNEALLFVVTHHKNCQLIFCPCQQIVERLLQSNSSSQDRTVKNSNLQKQQRQDKQNELKKDLQLFSEFLLSQIDHSIRNEQNPSLEIIKGVFNLQKAQLKVNNKKNKDKDITTSQTVKEQQNQVYELKLLRVCKLINNLCNYQKAYRYLVSLSEELELNDLDSCSRRGTISYLQKLLLQKKQQEIENSQKSNQLALGYFYQQETLSYLEKIVGNSIAQVERFWSELLKVEPDAQILTQCMERFGKYHEKIEKKYKKYQKSSRIASQVEVLINNYEDAIELTGMQKMTHTDAAIMKKPFKKENKNSTRNIKLFDQSSITDTFCFEITPSSFGNISYRNNFFKAGKFSKFENVSNFVLKPFQNNHNLLIEDFIENGGGNNRYMHNREDSRCFAMDNELKLQNTDIQCHILVAHTQSAIRMASFIRIEQKQQEKQHKHEMVFATDSHGQIIAENTQFSRNKQTFLEDFQFQGYLKNQFINQISVTEEIKLTINSIDYSVCLEKTIENQGEKIYFINIKDASTAQNPQERKKFYQINSNAQKTTKKTLNIQKILVKGFKDEIQIEGYDQKMAKIGKLFKTVTHPQDSKLLKWWLALSVTIILVFSIGTILVAWFSILRQQTFQVISFYMQIFSDLQISTAKSLWFLRVINIQSYLMIEQDSYPIISELNTDVRGFVEDLQMAISSISIYLTQTWPCLDILSFGRRIFRQQSSYSVLVNYVLSPLTSVIEGLNDDPSGMNFSPIESMVRVPYSKVQTNYLKFKNNALSFAIPNGISLREQIFETTFVSSINNIYSQPIFFVPIVGLLIGVTLLIYSQHMKKQIGLLYHEALAMFKHFNNNFAQKKVQNCEIYNRISLKCVANDRQKQGSNNVFTGLLTNNISSVFHTFLQQSLQKSQGVDARQQSNEMDSVKSSVYELSSEESGRQLNANENNMNPLSPQRCSFNRVQVKSQFSQQSKNSQSSIDIPKQMFAVQSGCINCKRILILLPIIVCYLYWIIFSFSYNTYISQILRLKSQLYYREEALAYMSAYILELGLYETKYDLGKELLSGIDKAYQTEQKIHALLQDIQSNIYGEVRYTKRAHETFYHGNICQNLQLLDLPSSNYIFRFTVQECENLYNGVLTHGFKQTFVDLFQSSRTLILEYNETYSLSFSERFQYLSNERRDKVSKLCYYMLYLSNYFIEEYEKDLTVILQIYKTFIISAGMISITLSTLFTILFVRLETSFTKKRLNDIRNSFLLIGCKELQRNLTLLGSKESGEIDRLEKFQMLQ